MNYLLFTAEWSKPSLEVKDTLLKFFPEINLLVVPLEGAAKEHTRYAIRRLPTLVKLKAEKEVGRTSAVDITELFKFIGADNVAKDVQ